MALLISDAATVIGLGKKTVPSRAALANGTFGLGFEFEDFHPWAGMHPASLVVPATLAAAELGKASGKALITAVVAGHEVIPRVRRVSNKTQDGVGLMARRLNSVCENLEQIKDCSSLATLLYPPQN